MPLAGQIIRALDFTPSVWAEEATNFDVTNALPFTTVGGPLCGVAFMAPTSGAGTLHIAAVGDSNDSIVSVAQISVSVREGGAVGSGTEVQAPNVNWIITVGEAGEFDVGRGFAVDVAGLSPGTTYNATLVHRRFGGNDPVSIFHRVIKWVPDASR